MSQKNKTVIDMGDPGLIHVKPELQTAFEHVPALLPDAFRLRFGALGDEHKVVGIAAVRHSKLPLPLFFDCGTSTSLDATIPVSEI